MTATARAVSRRVSQSTSVTQSHQMSSASAGWTGSGTTRTSTRPRKKSTANRQHCASAQANRWSCRIRRTLNETAGSEGPSGPRVGRTLADEVPAW